MKKRYLSVALIIALAGSMLSTSCIGSFALTNKVLDWNKSIGNKFVNEVVFFAFWILPVYEITALADALVLNSIEFWSGDNPMAKGTKVIEGQDGRYLVNCDGTGTNINNYTCTSQTSTFDQKDSSLSRIAYKGIQIEKTVDVFNGSVVEPGDTLTYTISITNNSDSEYNNISLVESIPTDLVVAENGSSILNWNVDTIPASTTYRKNYRVKVKNDKSLIGKKIISKGTVANIPSSTVTNTIGYNLNTTEKTAIESAYNDLKNTYSGINLIDKIYQKSLGYSLELTDLKLAAHHNTGNDSNNIKNLNQNCNSYFESTNSDALLNTVWGLYEGRNEILNQDHPLAKNVLNNYYSALFTEYQE